MGKSFRTLDEFLYPELKNFRALVARENFNEPSDVQEVYDAILIAVGLIEKTVGGENFNERSDI